ncbi:aldehyde dehydrogenase family protein [Oceanicoccus sp. KOV_DT_Chl]|uniref:aldehyde dehydrogenase family protein n=1 Tax=Oceanicoccus sp. KOV_DT_Chl TaxID=1904639 RepID=UPI000C7D96AB|nr:aldehyde dehydrogenase family protein [Oceanicoccus sp. KOV_DT_Chl]
MHQFQQFYINGQWVDPSGSGEITVIDPTTEQPCGSVPSGDAADVAAAVAAARAAFPAWSATSAAERSAFIGQLTAKLDENKEKLGAVIAQELGMPVAWSVAVQVGLPTGVMASYIELPAEMEQEEQIGNSLVVREAIGVCGFITPWNYPLHQIVGKVAPALAAGCTMVLKPSSETPLDAFLFAQIIDEVGLPPGVFNLVTGPGRVVGEALVSHPDVDMVSITGSTEAGIRIAELAAPTVKRVTQELGGKSACVILEGADLETAVGGSVIGLSMNTGQTCAALTRLIVPRASLDQVVAIAKAAAESVVVGGAFEEGAAMGPMVSKSQQETVRKYIRKGIEEGATLVTGGLDMPAGKTEGCFVAMTIFSDVTNDMVIAQEEIFGPVLCIIAYDTEEEAIAIANDSPFGLSGGVWAADAEAAKHVARKMRTGQVTINGGAFNLAAPFGGYKQSGNGRELGAVGLHEFIELKALHL